MTDINSSAESYRQQLQKLLPQGIAWPTEPDSTFVKLLDAMSQEFARVDAMCATLIDEVFPDTTSQLLTNHERVLGLPDDCSEIGESTTIRRLNVLAKLAARGGQSPQYFIDVAAALGYTITITEFNAFRAGISVAGDPVYSDAWEYAWQVNAPETSIVYFKAGISVAGDPLAEWGNDRLECAITKLKPAHTHVIFAYE
jgi:uncharacterized protein YmfQ (DUF2313 family)